MSVILDRLQDVVEGATPTTPRDFGDLVDDVFVLFARVLSKLPPSVCEQDLLRLENGELRSAVEKFVKSPYPRVYGSEGMQ
jgi:hypothetical protein